ncbi:conserved protein of unknown function [Nitrospira japonica]|uniref:Response regulatory domain-containing protein n=2 Tax=Nitrospira japonica TaxID=1325564 RepID=A0A1W1IA37_9BACT|nr:conserved protein of unknown function [Nitrospira japonica]
MTSVMKTTVLVVDDGIDSWNLLSTMLRTHQYYPVWAADGMQATNAALRHEPQAILLDLGLPAGDGFCVLERLKHNTRLSRIPVIVVTGRDPREAEEKARSLGADGYVQKPVKEDELITSLQQVLANRAGTPGR